jgi:hypothetical protein
MLLEVVGPCCRLRPRCRHDYCVTLGNAHGLRQFNWPEGGLLDVRWILGFSKTTFSLCDVVSTKRIKVERSFASGNQDFPKLQRAEFWFPELIEPMQSPAKVWCIGTSGLSHEPRRCNWSLKG